MVSGGMSDETECVRQGTSKSNLWNDEHEGGNGALSALLRQYEIYVESAEKVSQRRGTANNFFLLVNAAASIALTALATDEAAVWPALFSTLIMIGVCVLWAFTLHSYRQLNSAKWRIVNTIEERLPAAPWTAEWGLLDRGNARRKYMRLTTMEKLAPVLFTLIYAIGFVISVIVD